MVGKTPKQVCLYGFSLLLFLAAGSPAVAAVNPHYGEIVCTACHVDEEEYELHNEDPAVLCNGCHGEGRIVGHHHPLLAVPPEITVPEGWPLFGERLTCVTCHMPSCEKNLSEYMFLRGPKSVSLNEFCFLCHDREKVSKRNPHEEVNRGTGCRFCHDKEPVPGVDTLETVTFFSDPTLLCLRCHSDTLHPANFNHSRRLEEDIAEQLSKELNLYEKNTIVCSTCHNPHVDESQTLKLRGVVRGGEACPGCHEY